MFVVFRFVFFFLGKSKPQIRLESDELIFCFEFFFYRSLTSLAIQTLENTPSLDESGTDAVDVTIEDNIQQTGKARV